MRGTCPNVYHSDWALLYFGADESLLCFSPPTRSILGRGLCEKWKPPDQIPSLQGVSVYVRYTVMQRVQHRVEQLAGGCNSSLQTSLRSLPVERCKTDNSCVLLWGFLQLCGIEWVVNSQPTAKCCISHLGNVVFSDWTSALNWFCTFISTRITVMNGSSDLISEPRGLTWPSWLCRGFIKTRLGEDGRRPEGSASNFPSWLNWHVHYCDATDTKHPLLHWA